MTPEPAMTPESDRLPEIGPALRLAAARYGTPCYVTLSLIHI